MTSEEVIKELIQIAGRPTEEPPVEKVAEEDDCEYAPNNDIYVVLSGVFVCCKEHVTKLKIVMENLQYCHPAKCSKPRTI